MGSLSTLDTLTTGLYQPTQKNGSNIVVKRTDKLTSAEYKACDSLNMRSKGMMQGKLRFCRQRGHGWVFMIFDGDKLMSWAIVFNAYYSASDEKGAYFYTRVSARGKGYGSQILDAIKKFTDQVTCYPWNNTSDRFFTKRAVGKNYGFWKAGEKRYAA